MAAGPAGDLADVSSTPDENEYPSGFPHSICDDVPQDKYLCSNCNNVLNKARQTMCGHRYCLACVNWLVRNNKNLVCKRCREEDRSLEGDNSILTPDNVFNDAAINKEILELRVHCANQGCSWRGILKDYEEHQSGCDHALIPCNIGCGHMVERKKLASHLAKGCPNNMSPCPTCSQAMSPTELQKHICQSSAVERHPATALRGEKNQLPSSSGATEQCCFSEVGCRFKGTAEMIKVHQDSSHAGHLQLLLQVTAALQALLLTAKARGPDSPLQEALAALQLQGGVELDGGGIVGAEDVGVPEESATAHSLQDDQAAVLLGKHLEELQQRVDVYENIVTVLNREVEKTQVTVATLEQQNQSNQEIIQHLEIQVLEQQRKLAMKDVLIASLHQRITAQEDVSYNGTFIWKLCDISKKMNEAASGRRNNQYSPAFYTSRYGFKVCMRLYLNGDGVGRGTHISLFFVVMKGEYDALLSWPFKHKVTFSLLDQNHKEHVVDAFRPDLSSSSFQRPVSDMNVASGCPLFFPLAKLRSPRHAYIKDDTLFIKCTVDTLS
ncbi:TNF receptor-associated factor 1 [Megalops cyprinoides]|uniref:TNF receptor-associated factor 1 n=1 Tax=Megalops cyprinoides TaxID=118141 RepID=UPI001864D9D0|nr:TNF receptor-associated factor 1 [Megalops cyprinoides]